MAEYEEEETMQILQKQFMPYRSIRFPEEKTNV